MSIYVLMQVLLLGESSAAELTAEPFDLHVNSHKVSLQAKSRRKNFSAALECADEIFPIIEVALGIKHLVEELKDLLLGALGEHLVH
jgi:hypothetical protein